MAAPGRMSPMDIAFLTIAELNRLYRQRELSPVEVTKALLARIAAHDGKLHSFLRLTEEIALAEAEAAERELMAGTSRGPMHGIPYALKDIIETAGILTTGHSKLRQDHVPAADAELVTRLKAGGGIMLGKLATWEFALGGPSWDLPWPPARNPWNPDYLPGGSSSGAGAAVAAGFVRPGQPARRLSEHLHHGPLRPADPQRRGHRAIPASHRRLRCRGPGQRGCSGARLSRGSDREDRGAAFRTSRALVCPGRPPRPCAGDLGRGRGLAWARRGGRAGAIVEPARLHRLQDDDLDRRALRDPREGPEDAATGFRS